MNTKIKASLAALLISLISASFSAAQKLDKIGRLSKELNEISGLIPFGDSLFICHNDSGDSARLFVIDKYGQLIRSVKITGASAKDWEDITCDQKGNVYIADIGNNLNKRKDLLIYKIKTDSLLTANSLRAQKIIFSYEDQFDFPPNENAQNFDAEALGFYDDSLYIFTKCRTKPYSGISNCYVLSANPGKHIARKSFQLQLKTKSMRKNAVTGAFFDANKLFLLTYSGIEEYEMSRLLPIHKRSVPFRIWTQKEAICRSKGTIYLADERVYFFGGNLYQIIE